MKALSVIVFSVLFLLFGCATNPAVTPTPQKVIIEVVSAIDSKVAVEKGRVNQAMEVSNPEGELSPLSFIFGDRAFMKIYSGLSVADVTRSWGDFMYLFYNTKIREVDLFINSPGGDAFSGLALADQIQCAKKMGFKITAHASGIIASAAVPVFAVCDVRMAAPGTIFMVHEAALWKWPGRETASDIQSQNDLMFLLRDLYISKLVDNTKLNKDQWQKLEKQTHWFSADKALEYGLVDSIE